MPIGNDFETYWRNLREGVSGVARITAEAVLAAILTDRQRSGS